MVDPGQTLIDSAYRLRIDELQRKESDAESELLGRMRSGGRPGNDLAVLRQVGGKLADEALDRVSAAIPDLIQIHIDAGERDPGRIVASLLERFVNVCLGHFPGASLYASLRGGIGVSADGARLRQSEQAAFSARKASLEKTVEAHVAFALARLDRPSLQRNHHAADQAQSPVRQSQLRNELVFIGHGRSAAWRELKDFLFERLGLLWEEFNREPTAGLSTKERLQAMLERSTFAFLIMTGEDSGGDGSRVARANVIHEVGLFQGRLGFERAVILLEEGCSEFSNIVGLSQIRFPQNRISACFEEVRRVLEREGLLSKDC